jgi:hypothetical protein
VQRRARACEELRHALKRRIERISGVEPTKRPRHPCRVKTRLRVLLDLDGRTPWRQSLALLFGERLGQPSQVSGRFVHGYGNGVGEQPAGKNCKLSRFHTMHCPRPLSIQSQRTPRPGHRQKARACADQRGAWNVRQFWCPVWAHKARNRVQSSEMGEQSEKR